MTNEATKRIVATIRPIFTALRRATEDPFMGMSASLKRFRQSDVTDRVNL